jgi:P27 family predicted phage terminase small subunit
MGRARKPAALKILDGNPGKRPIKDEPKPVPIAPDCPIWLPQFAQEEWQRVYRQLEQLGLLTQVDGTAFEAYCMAYGQWKESHLILREKGLTFMTPNGYEQQRPEVAIANNAAKIMRGFMIEFGLTPAARARMGTDPKAGEDDGSDFFAKAQ